MSNAQMKEFENRLAQIDRIHAAGGAFEANGALGRSYFDSVRSKPRGRTPLRAVALLFLGAILFKGAVYAQLGSAIYDSRLLDLSEGGFAAQVVAWMLQAGAATQLVGGMLHALLY